MKSLYVCNLNYRTSQEEISELFGSYGAVDNVNLIKDKQTGRSKGYAFVTMAAEGADQAVNTLNNSDFGGRVISVSFARRQP